MQCTHCGSKSLIKDEYGDIICMMCSRPIAKKPEPLPITSLGERVR